MAEPPVRFAGVLRRLRAGAGLTQEELATAAGLSSRAVSDLERGVVTTPHKDTVRLLADALRLTGPARAEFETVARSGAGAGTGGVAAATRTLPRDIASFTGRRQELAELADAAAGAGAGAIVSIHAIGGMAGIGKTAFAVHAAHRLAGRFPGGQIFLPLHGHTPGQQPVGPAGALASLLRTIGVPAAQIPAGLEARTGLWRDRLAGQQLLLILDDAVGSEQVRPLLPGSGGSLVLVTSRRRLTALEDATTISLDTLPPPEAAGLLVRLAARPGLSPADPAVAEITRLCGFLPLAIGMLARQLHHHPAWTTAGRAAELAAAVNRLELLATENLSVAAAFDLSYADLTPGQQRLFRRLGLHPGAEVDGYAAAALDGTNREVARRGLEALYDQYLLTEPAPGRYRMHDLIREHARTLAERDEPARDRNQATARLLACLDHATATGQHASIIGLTATLAGLLRSDGPWAEAITRHQTAIQAAQHLGNRRGQAGALTDLADVRRLTGEYPAAARDLEQALGIYRDLGDRLGQAHALNDLGTVALVTGESPAAARDLEQALAIYRDLGDRLGQAHALCDLGLLRLMTGDYHTAAQALEQALGIYRDLGNRIGQANALIYLGDVRRMTGDYPAAGQDLEQALGISRELGNRLPQANALGILGAVRRMTGDYPAAARALEQALSILHELGDRGGEAEVLNERATLYRASGDLAQAKRCHRQALDLARAIDSSWDEAHALAGLGRCALAAGQATQAKALLRKALQIFQRIGSGEAADVSAEVDALSGLEAGRSKP